MDARYPQQLWHATSSGSVLHNATTKSQDEAQRLRHTKSLYFRSVVEQPHSDSQQPRRSKSSYFKRDVERPRDGNQHPRRTKSSYFRHDPKSSEDSCAETKPQHNFVSKLKAVFTKSHKRSSSNTPSQLASKLQMSRLEYRIYALNHYSTPQQYHRIHLSSIVFHPITNHLLLVKDPIGQKFSIPETAMFTRHPSLGEALREGLLERTGLRISEVKREVLPVWEFEGAWKFGNGNMGMKSVMLNFVVEVENLEAAGRDTIWVGEQCVDGLEMDRGMKNLVKWVFDERVGANW